MRARSPTWTSASGAPTGRNRAGAWRRPPARATRRFPLPLRSEPHRGSVRLRDGRPARPTAGRSGSKAFRVTSRAPRLRRLRAPTPRGSMKRPLGVRPFAPTQSTLLPYAFFNLSNQRGLTNPGASYHAWTRDDNRYPLTQPYSFTVTNSDACSKIIQFGISSYREGHRPGVEQQRHRLSRRLRDQAHRPRAACGQQHDVVHEPADRLDGRQGHLDWQAPRRSTRGWACAG